MNARNTPPLSSVAALVRSELKVDVWSDVACPWCYVGKRRFAEGVRRYRAAGGGGVAVEYHSFELAPDTPVDFQGSEADFLSHHEGLPLPQVRQMLSQMTEVARGEGLDFDYDSLKHTNTLKAHEALHAAKAAEVGLDRESVLRALREGSYRADVAADIAEARAYGIRGVPFYVIEHTHGVSGAQAPDVFAGALRRAADEIEVGA